MSSTSTPPHARGSSLRTLNRGFRRLRWLDLAGSPVQHRLLDVIDCESRTKARVLLEGNPDLPCLRTDRNIGVRHITSHNPHQKRSAHRFGPLDRYNLRTVDDAPSAVPRKHGGVN